VSSSVLVATFSGTVLFPLLCYFTRNNLRKCS